jgi:hypothetical protein
VSAPTFCDGEIEFGKHIPSLTYLSFDVLQKDKALCSKLDENIQWLVQSCPSTNAAVDKIHSAINKKLITADSVLIKTMSEENSSIYSHLVEHVRIQPEERLNIIKKDFAEIFKNIILKKRLEESLQSLSTKSLYARVHRKK